MLSLGLKDTTWPRFSALTLWVLFRKHGEQRGLGFSLPCTCVVPLYCLLSGFTFNQVRTLDSLFENETLLALVPSPSAAGTPSLALAVGGSLGGRGPGVGLCSPSRGDGAPSGSGGWLASACHCTADFSCSASPVPRRAPSSQNLNSTLLLASGAWNLQRPRKMSKDSRNMCWFYIFVLKILVATEEMETRFSCKIYRCPKAKINWKLPAS